MNVWTLGVANSVTMEQFWAWAKVYHVYSDIYEVMGAESSVKFEKDLCFELGKSMRRKFFLYVRTTSNIFTMIL